MFSNVISQTKNKQVLQPKVIYILIYTFLIFFLTIFGRHSSYAQESKVDSLLKMLPQTTVDIQRINLLEELTIESMNINLMHALTYAREALDLSQRINDQHKEAVALNNMALVLYETEERESSLQYFEESERIANKLKLRELQARNLMSIAKFHRYTSHDSTKTVNNFLKSIEVSKEANFHWGTGRSYAKLASFYTQYNQIDLSEKYLELAIEYYIQHPTGKQTIAHYYNEVGDKIWDTNPMKAMDFYLKGKEFALIPNLMTSLAKAYNYIGDHQTALDYLKAAIPYFRKTEKTRRMLGIAIGQYAEVNLQLGNFEAADKACDEGISLLKNLGRADQRAIPSLYRTKGIIMEKKGDREEALQYFTKSLKEAIKIKQASERVKSNLKIGTFLSSNNPQKAKTYCEKSFKEAQKKGYINIEIEACDCLYNIYKKELAYTSALKFHEQKTILKDSITGLKVRHSLDIVGKISEKDKQLAEQAYQEKIKDEELKNQYNLSTFLMVSTLIGLLLIGVLTLSYKRISRQNKEINEKKQELIKANHSLEQSNEELERFAHIASHDLKSPLRNIVSFTGLLRLKLEKQNNYSAQDLLTYIENSGQRMNQLIEDVLEYSQLSSSSNQDKEIVNSNELIEEIIQLVQNQPGLKPINFDLSKLPNIKWHYSKMFLLFKNIIENGIKYNKSENPVIKIYSVKNPESYSVYIEDNGIGIEKKYFDKIFVMFNRLHTKGEYEGTGLGLAICKKIVDELGGEISISSEIGKWTKFKIDFPKNLIHSVNTKEEEYHIAT